MEFSAAVEAAYKNYFDFSGQATRSEYWWFALWNMLVVIAMVALAGAALLLLHRSSAAALLLGLLALIPAVITLASIIPAYAVAVRRLHDAGHTGYWIFSQIGLGILISLLRHTLGRDLGSTTLLLLCDLFSMVINIAVLVFLCQPSKRGYGTAAWR